MHRQLQSPGVTESVLYVEDLARAIRFYTVLLGVPVIREMERFAALRLNDSQVLLLFRRGGSLSPTVLDGGTVPAHDGVGPHHICFGMGNAEVTEWEAHLERLGIAIESRVHWPSGAV